MKRMPWHGVKDHYLVNIINYCANQFLPGWTFYGLVEVSADNGYIGISFGENGRDDPDRIFVAVHVATEPMERIISDHEERERRYIQRGYLYPVMFYGTDNCSYVRRFPSQERAVRWLQNQQNSTKGIDFTDECYMMYNS